MIRLQELLEKDKEKLLRNLGEAGTPDKAADILMKECDRLLYCYAEELDGSGSSGGAGYGSREKTHANEERMRAAGELLEAVKLTIPLSDSIGETKIYERRETKEEKKARKLPKTIFLILLSAGILLSILSVVLLAVSAPQEKLVLSGMLRSIGMLAASLICLLLAGLSLSKLYAPVEEEKERKIENRVDAEKQYRTLRAAVIAIDRDLDDLEGRLKRDKTAGGGSTVFAKSAVNELTGTGLLQGASAADGGETSAAAAGIGERELKLYSDLLAAACVGDKEAALDGIGNLKYYLHTRGIEALPYSEETKDYFERMPSSERATLRPALVADGVLLLKGFATEKTMG